MEGSFLLVEERFGLNDIFVISLIIVLYGLIFTIKSPFRNRMISFLLIMWGIVVAGLFDNTLGASPYDYYDIMDGEKYTDMDLVAYLLYGPFGYFFIYIMEKWKIKNIRLLLYILAWSLMGIAFEYVNVKVGVFIYKNGYELFFSFPIYLFTQTALVYFYKFIISDGVKTLSQ
ncbi:hypothetical protein FZC78_02710 [Rossellomorea vietnamensis]|uniref:Uncharacterized protein n=1 Tax=Rossellomorea vietnamensis TaxID=218284 RepID=A0A5D4NY81_9BACI|nr:hypothetical protein [Rossellomorea vietnamensis]TYS18468.1 hypothetical protein FZC78_02710 [Rossellomorea vietnamensis]